jgi:SAM-dependent methyltransferase
MLKKLKAKVAGKVKEATSNWLWDQSADQYIKNGFKVYWETLPIVAHYQFQCMTGDANKNYLDYTIEYLQKHVGTENLRGLSIGCLEMSAAEMTLFKTGYFRAFDVMDIAGGLLERQERKATEQGLEGITYIKQDLNHVDLGQNQYDLIWAVGTIHHIENLEAFFDQVQSALTEGGVFVMREYVGPNRIQLTDEQLALTNEILSYLPEKYKRTPQATIKTQEHRVDVNALIELDPSESVRSEDLLAIFKEKLDVIQLAPTGGTLLMPLLNNIASNFEQDQEGEAFLRIVIMLERMLIENKILPSDYVFCMARKKM